MEILLRIEICHFGKLRLMKSETLLIMKRLPLIRARERDEKEHIRCISREVSQQNLVYAT